MTEPLVLPATRLHTMAHAVMISPSVTIAITPTRSSSKKIAPMAAIPHPWATTAPSAKLAAPLRPKIAMLPALQNAKPFAPPTFLPVTTGMALQMRSFP